MLYAAVSIKETRFPPACELLFSDPQPNNFPFLRLHPSRQHMKPSLDLVLFSCNFQGLTYFPVPFLGPRRLHRRSTMVPPHKAHPARHTTLAIWIHPTTTRHPDGLELHLCMVGGLCSGWSPFFIATSLERVCPSTYIAPDLV
jgi:hypothetical protein